MAATTGTLDVWANDFEVVETYDGDELEKAKRHAERINGHVADERGEVIWEVSRPLLVTLPLADYQADVPWSGQRFPPPGTWEPCVLCDRPVRIDRRHHRISLVHHGISIAAEPLPADIDTNEAHGWHGTFAVGPVCRKRLPKKFVEIESH